MVLPEETADAEDFENETDDVVDPEMMGLSLNDQKWYVVQKGFAQVKAFCEEIGLPHLYETFLEHRFYYGNKIRLITQWQLKYSFKMTDEDEMEAILAASAKLKNRPELTNFVKRYGDPDTLIYESVEGQQWVKDHAGTFAEYDPSQRNVDTSQKDSVDDISMSFVDKWKIQQEDFDNFSSTDGMWASASSCDGMVFLWPLDRPLENAADNNFSPGCVRAAYCHPMICTDYSFDFEQMVSMSCGGDCRVVYYSMENNKIISTVKNDKGVDIKNAFYCIDGDCVAGKVAVGAAHGVVKIGDQERGKMVQILKGHLDDIYDIKANWDENMVITGAWDHTLGVFDLRSGKRVRTLTGHSAVVNRIDVCFEQMMADPSCVWM
jgi:WD40 repeat protein